MNKKLNSLQVFRAISGLMIVMFHITQLSRDIYSYNFFNSIFLYGIVGIDAFFVLSGFIIFYVHHNDLGHKNKIKPFLIKRIIRIYPTYWIASAMVIPLSFFLPTLRDHFENDFGFFIKSLLLWPNNYIVTVAWSLNYEILFYSLFAFVIGFHPKIRWLLLTIWLTGIAVYMFSLMANLKDIIILFDHPLLKFIFNSNNLEFIVGCLSAYIFIRCKIKNGLSLFVIGCVLLLIVPVFVILEITGVRGGLATLIYCLAFSLAIIGLASHDTGSKNIFQKFFIYLGDASYSIYLVHMPLQHLIVATFLELDPSLIVSPFWVLIIATMLSVWGGCLMHKFVEKPLLLILKNKYVSN